MRTSSFISFYHTENGNVINCPIDLRHRYDRLLQSLNGSFQGDDDCILSVLKPWYLASTFSSKTGFTKKKLKIIG